MAISAGGAGIAVPLAAPNRSFDLSTCSVADLFSEANCSLAASAFTSDGFPADCSRTDRSRTARSWRAVATPSVRTSDRRWAISRTSRGCNSKGRTSAAVTITSTAASNEAASASPLPNRLRAGCGATATSDSSGPLSACPPFAAIAATTARRSVGDRGRSLFVRPARNAAASRPISSTVRRSSCRPGSASSRSTTACSSPSSCPRACAVSSASAASRSRGAGWSLLNWSLLNWSLLNWESLMFSAVMVYLGGCVRSSMRSARADGRLAPAGRAPAGAHGGR